MDKSMTLTVKPKTCWRRRKILGYCTLDLATIWNQPDHLFFQKWAILTSTSPEYTGPRGYLKVTLCILTKGTQAKIPLVNPTINEQIEGNLLLPEGITLERQKALFIFKVYKGEEILKFKSTMIDILKKSRHSKELPCTLIEITFAGITVSTTIQKHTSKPVWNEMLTIAELFPPLCQRIKVVLKVTNSSLRAVKYINLHSIANDQEDGFLPTFGPTYVNFYTSDKFGSVFVGRVLMALHTQMQHDARLKSIIRKPLMPLNENNLYKYEPVLLFVAILDVNTIDKRFSKKSIQFGISVGCPKISSYMNPAGEMYPINMTPPFISIKADDPYWYLDFKDRIACISFQNNFPDLRRRFYNANVIDQMTTDFKARLDAIEPFFEYERMQIPSDIIQTKLIEALDRLAIACRKYIDMMEPNADIFVTELDKEKLKLCLREMVNLRFRATGKNDIQFKNKKEVLPESTKALSTFSFVNRSPSFELKIDTSKPNSEINIAIFQCRAHIYQGNLKFGTDSSGLSNLFARVIISKFSASTEVKKAALNPHWNETLTVTNVVIYGSREYLKAHPPSVVIEVIDRESQNDLIGRTFIKSSIKFKDEPYTQPDFPPKLEWHRVLKHNDTVGEIVACVELLEITSFVDLKRSKHKKELSEIPEDIQPKLTRYKIDVMFWGVRHLRKLHNISITKPKVTLDFTVATLESDILQKYEQNFTNHKKDLIVDLPQEDKYVPALVFKLFDNRSFGRFTYVGNHIVKIHRFLCYPLTREERDHKLSESQQKSYDSMDSKAPSVEQIIIPKPSPIATIVPEFKVENEVVGCCAFCKRASKRKQVTDPEKETSTHSMNEFEKDITEEDEFTDWWNKYFFSVEKPSKSNTTTDTERPISKSFRLKIYDDELEHQPEFSYLQDTLISFKLIRGEPTGDDEIDAKNIMGVFKGNIKVYPWPSNKNLEYVSLSGLPLKNNYFERFPSNESISYLARVYCIRGIKLRPKDMAGKSDPFLVAFMGNQHYNDAKNYIPKEINPIFGNNGTCLYLCRCFEFSGTFPLDTVVTIQVWDWDRNSHHDLIGETQIDLENRYYTKHRAHCGLPYEYTEVGYTPWRDIQTPSEILERLCVRWNIPQPQYFDTYVRINNLMFAPKLEEDEKPKAIYSKHELALNVLHRWNEIPVVGCHLVPEHVETRSLYTPHHPGLEQGKLQCWVDVFPVSDLPPPRPVDITPHTPRKYELRVIIWNTEDVILEEDDFFTGEKKSDIYVKGWLTGTDDAQSTDVHYRSLGGEGNFNWRFVFPFRYLKTEHKIVVVKREKAFDLVHSERKVPCVLKLQVWDNDTFSPDDFLGSIALDLRRMPRCARSSKKCTLELLKPYAPKINLFKIKRIRGWWPFRGTDQKKMKVFLL
ncbi:fer-1-like [Holotrichia oblita]|uniref:Fer-1-like n=1 Tax=Holotrichia oblita TaxID=644536 RepID=A0ACB9TWK0_HOLOL|nr:fer-1-like [Holotrichia oblita]